MRSRSLFNFFTKAAGGGGPRVYRGAADADKLMEQTADSAKAVSDAVSDRGASMTPQTRYYEVFGRYLRDYGDPNYGGSVRHAYSNFIDHLRGEVAAGRLSSRNYYNARDHIRARLASDQFNKMWEDYHTYTSPGLYGDTAASSSRMNSRMIHNGNQAQYIFTPNADDRGWNPANMTYEEFGKFFTGADGQMMTREDALAKWNQAWQARSARGSNGTAVGARSTARANNDTSWRAEAARQQQAAHNAYADSKANNDNPATPLNFKGGYSVNFNPNYVQNWTRPSEATGNWVNGTWYTDEQYMAYNDIYRQLVSSMTGSGRMSQPQAKAEASRLARMYMEDQMRLRSGHVATNDWMESQQTAAPATPAAPAPAPAPAPAEPSEPIPTEQSTGNADGMSAFAPTNDNNAHVVGGGVISPANALTALYIPNTSGTTSELYSPGDNGLLNLNGGTQFPLTLDPQATGIKNLSEYTTATTNLLNNSNAPTASSQTGNGTVDTPPAAPGTTTDPAYEAGFEHTSQEDFIRDFGEEATNNTLLKHYRTQTWNNMRYLRTRITNLRREGRGESDECKRLIAQFELARNRYTSIVHAMDDMSQDELYDIYMPKFNWIFDAANDSSDYWREHHAPLGSSGLHSRSDRLHAMPEEYAEFNTLW